MTGGIVIGGWEYVWAAYGISFGVLATYGASLFLRVRKEKRLQQEQDQ